MTVAVYPGTFDPFTRGHEDLVRRAASIFDELIVGVASSRSKHPFFTLDERIDIAKEVLSHYSNVKVVGFNGLLKDFAREHNARVIVRGLRAVSDFEYEFQMFGMNSKLEPDIQTIFLPASENHHFIASKLVKEVAKLRGDISKFVSTNVIEALNKKIKNNA